MINNTKLSRGRETKFVCAYSRVVVVFVFHLNTNKDGIKKAESSGYQTFPSKVRPTTLGGKRVGVFTIRTTHRPAPIGFSLCKIDSIAWI